DPSRAADLESLAIERRMPFARLGETGGPRMVFGEELEVAVGEAREVYESAIPDLVELRRAAG
ncbi:MAG: hypothetical protein ACRDH1_08815, partial [Actinomycetota bacterium]